MRVSRESKIGTAEVESSLQYLNGCELYACLDWDEYKYELWFEIHPHMYDSLDEFPSLQSVIDEAMEDINDFGVACCFDLDEVNRYIKHFNGDSDFAGFVDDEIFGIMGV